MLQPFFFVGVGGSGGKTLRVIRAELESRLRAVNWDKDFPNAWQFLHIDVPTKADGDDPDLPPQLPNDCYVALAKPNIPYKTIDATLMAGTSGANGQFQLRSLAGWRPRPSDVHVPIHKGAGQFRALGRAVALAGLDDIRSRVRIAANKLGLPEVGEELRELTDHFAAGAKSTQPQIPVVVVVSSLAGGAGAGIFLDVCDAISIEIGTVWASQSVGILYAPDIFAELNDGAKRGVNGNALATISELCAAFHNREEPSESEYAIFHKAGLPAGDLDRRGPQYPFLVGGSNGLVNFGNQNNAYRAMGRTLAAWIVSSRVQGSMSAYLQGNLLSAAGDMATRSTFGLIGEAGMTPLNALGSSAVTTGRDRFAAYTAERLARLAVERLLRAHMEGQSRETKSEVAIETLVRQQQREFVALSGLNEVGADRNDILDALRPSDRDRRWDEFAARVKAGLGGTPRTEAVFDQATQGAFDEQNKRELATDQVEVHRNAREWVGRIQQQIVGLVSSHAADFGLAVTTRLVEGLIRELDEVVVDLDQERQKFDAWASKRVERISQQLSGGSKGPIKPDHPKVATAIRAGIECLDWSSEADLRVVAIDLVGDLRDNFLAPMVRAIQKAADTLAEQEAGNDASQASVVQHWPTGSGVPTRFEPAPNERLIEGTDRFAENFEAQIRASVLTDDPAGAVRAAVRNVIEGRRRADRPSRLVSVRGRWVPRRAELRDLDSGPPAAAAFDVACEVDQLLDRATRWVSDPDPNNAISKFVSQPLRDYLAPENTDPVEHNRRLSSFSSAFAAAIETARPLVNINNATLALAYGSGEPSFDIVITELPFTRATPAYNAAKDVLVSHGLIKEAEEAFSEGPQNRIDIFSFLSEPYEPAVFDSLMAPIASDYARTGGDIGQFWQWRRSRPLPHFIPVSPTVRRAMVRGWWTAMLLNQIEGEPERPIKIFVPERGTMAGFPDPLLCGTVYDRFERLPSVLESLPLAWVHFNSGDRRAVEPYKRLRQLGSTKRGSDRSYDILNGELEDWILRGITAKDAPLPKDSTAGDSSMTWEERRKCVVHYLENQDRNYADLIDSAIESRDEQFFRTTRVWELGEDIRAGFRDLIQAARLCSITTDIE